MNVRLSERDLKVLAKCAVSKWLTTGQLRQLYFQNVTADAACKSLRRLVRAGQLVSFRINRMTEALHAVGPKGKGALAMRGLEVEVSRRPPRQLEHMIGINEIRVALEMEPKRVAYFFACWEIGRFRWTGPVIPDAIIQLNSPERYRFALEFDRGSEPFNVLWRKFQSYEAIIAELSIDAVLLVTETEEHLQLIMRKINTRVLPMPILGASLAHIRRAGIYAPVFRDFNDPKRPEASLGDALAESKPCRLFL